MTTPAVILIVEDEMLVAADLRYHLTNMGYTIAESLTTGEKAVQWLETNRPDLILMDIQLAGAIDGITAAELICARFNIPVIYLTAFADEETFRRAKLIQTFGYIIKPFSSLDLRTAIEMALYKHRMETALRQSEEKYRTVADFTYDWEEWIGPEGHYLYVSPACECISGYNREEFMADPGLMLAIIHPDERETARHHYHETRQPDHKEAVRLDFRIITRTGEERWISHACQPIFDDNGRWLGRRSSNRDITKRKQNEFEREQLITELQTALAQVKRLSGLLPICAVCKKIRDDRGYWQQVEVYIHDHSEADFSHSICPDCKLKLYPKEQFPYLYSEE